MGVANLGSLMDDVGVSNYDYGAIVVGIAGLWVLLIIVFGAFR